MTGGCGIGAWETNSRIVRATAASPLDEFTVEEVIKPTFAHEPVLAGPLTAANGGNVSGHWLLFSIGNASSSAPARDDCSGGYTPRSGGGGFERAVPVEIYISEGISPAGPWRRLPRSVGQGDINPAPLVLPNGSAIMMWRCPRTPITPESPTRPRAAIGRRPALPGTPPATPDPCLRIRACDSV